MNASPTEDDDTASEAGSVNSCEEFISFESIRDPSTNLEHCICLSWPGIYDESYASSTDGDSIKSHINVSKELRRIKLTTLLEEDDIAPIFDGSRWAGTRLWNAAVRGIQYITGHLESKSAFLEHVSPDPNQRVTMLELGCGLGVPGMIYHLLGGNVVLTDQANILGQLEKNVGNNFPESLTSSESTFCRDAHSIRAMPLSWSKEGISELLDQLNLSEIGFDIVLNCDCVFEPLYGKSWMPLNETINELLRINPQCVVITSVERRRGDNIDSFLEMMRGMEFVGHVEQVWKDDDRKPVEIYVTRGISR